jgi:glycine cleavage system H protein
MSNIPAELKYTKSHEWVRVSGGEAVVGITDHAQHELTDVVFVELPETGRQVKAGEACAVVESVKTAVAGWLFKVKLSNEAEINALLTADQYKAQIGG